MAIVNLHIRFAWGLFDGSLEASSPGYSFPTQYATLGPSATLDGGIGVRRATLQLDRTTGVTPADDAALMHFDFLNITSGAPDDTWITSDYTTLEGYITTWWAAVHNTVPPWYKLSRILWHRIGPGAPVPNPAERILDIATPVSGSGGTALPPQVACSITFRTGVRHSWGRTYLPFGSTVTAGRADATPLGNIGPSTQTMLTSAAGSDFHPVVTSLARQSALGIDFVEVDDVLDIVRRRRWKHTLTRNILPVT